MGKNNDWRGDLMKSEWRFRGHIARIVSLIFLGIGFYVLYVGYIKGEGDVESSLSIFFILLFASVAFFGVSYFYLPFKKN